MTWEDKRVLIVVRTYPVPARKGIEVSCTAGVTDSGQWVRLFPVPYRFLDTDKRFRKYQWIDVSVLKAANDPRPESYKLNADSIRVGESVSSENQWRARRKLLRPLVRHSLCEIQRTRSQNGFPTLGLFKPAQIKRLVIEPAKQPDWTLEQADLLRQTLLFSNNPDQPLEKVPLDFRYEFTCQDPQCTGHRMICTDWEMGQSYRVWTKKYGADWEAAFRHRYEKEMIEKFDTHFYVGTLHQYPDVWIIVGLFYPPPITAPDLF